MPKLYVGVPITELPEDVTIWQVEPWHWARGFPYVADYATYSSAWFYAGEGLDGKRLSDRDKARVLEDHARHAQHQGYWRGCLLCEAESKCPITD